MRLDKKEFLKEVSDEDSLSLPPQEDQLLKHS